MNTSFVNNSSDWAKKISQPTTEKSTVPDGRETKTGRKIWIVCSCTSCKIFFNGLALNIKSWFTLKGRKVEKISDNAAQKEVMKQLLEQHKSGIDRILMSYEESLALDKKRKDVEEILRKFNEVQIASGKSSAVDVSTQTESGNLSLRKCSSIRREASTYATVPAPPACSDASVLSTHAIDGGLNPNISSMDISLFRSNSALENDIYSSALELLSKELLELEKTQVGFSDSSTETESSHHSMRKESSVSDGISVINTTNSTGLATKADTLSLKITEGEIAHSDSDRRSLGLSEEVRTTLQQEAIRISRSHPEIFVGENDAVNKLLEVTKLAAEEIETYGSWNNDIGGQAPLILVNAQTWPKNLCLRVDEINIRQVNGKDVVCRHTNYLAKDHKNLLSPKLGAEIITLELNLNHFSPIVNGRKIDVAGDGNCFYRALLVAMNKKQKQEFLGDDYVIGDSEDAIRANVINIRSICAKQIKQRPDIYAFQLLDLKYGSDFQIQSNPNQSSITNQELIPSKMINDSTAKESVRRPSIYSAIGEEGEVLGQLAPNQMRHLELLG